MQKLKDILIGLLGLTACIYQDAKKQNNMTTHQKMKPIGKHHLKFDQFQIQWL